MGALATPSHVAAIFTVFEFNPEESFCAAQSNIG
jgi:hypothetical protein